MKTQKQGIIAHKFIVCQMMLMG